MKGNWVAIKGRVCQPIKQLEEGGLTHGLQEDIRYDVLARGQALPERNPILELLQQCNVELHHVPDIRKHSRDLARSQHLVLLEGFQTFLISIVSQEGDNRVA